MKVAFTDSLTTKDYLKDRDVNLSKQRNLVRERSHLLCHIAYCGAVNTASYHLYIVSASCQYAGWPSTEPRLLKDSRLRAPIGGGAPHESLPPTRHGVAMTPRMVITNAKVRISSATDQHRHIRRAALEAKRTEDLDGP